MTMNVLDAYIITWRLLLGCCESVMKLYDGLVQDCGNSIANTLEFLQSGAKQ